MTPECPLQIRPRYPHITLHKPAKKSAQNPQHLTGTHRPHLAGRAAYPLVLNQSLYKILRVLTLLASVLLQ